MTPLPPPPPLEKVKYQACLAITGAIQATSQRVFIRNLELDLYGVGGGISK